MGVFKSLVKSKEVNDKNESKSKYNPSKYNPFDIIYKIYDIINKAPDDYKKQLDDLLRNVDKSNFNFLVWVLNHYLVYNKFTREYLELFTLTSNTFLSPEEYIYFYVSFMIKNEVKFPKYMSWYKFGIHQEDKHFRDIIKSLGIEDDEEIDDLFNYLKNKNISAREICLNLVYTEQ